MASELESHATVQCKDSAGWMTRVWEFRNISPLARSVAGRAQVCSLEGSISTSTLSFRQCPSYVTTHSGVNLEFVLQFTALSEDKCVDRNWPTEVTLRLQNVPFLRPGLKKFKIGSNDNDNWSCFITIRNFTKSWTRYICTSSSKYSHRNVSSHPPDHSKQKLHIF